ncbi:MAG TPA: UDP-3-O-(3-hydroxymyristoyl)glucosamine N-acyltransferase [Candidatus Eremiobacteraceae bacterium]|nr:UDP-3-O-(3-hydroxymyristoyl)glucosamine N-acyltransferase [Candidatus Eremiobacteraceae bacterium]
MARPGKQLGELAAAAGAKVVGDAAATIDRVASVDEADERALTFAVDERWLKKALDSRACAIIVPATLPLQSERGKTFLVVDEVRQALAAILHVFEPPQPHGEFTHPSAVVESNVSRGQNVWIGAGVIVREGAILRDGVVLLPGSYVGRNVLIGADSLLHPHATVLDDCVLGSECVLQAGCVIGSDGFGFVRVGAEQIKIPQVGNVIVGDRVEIGACTTIDRAVTDATIIGAGTKIDNLVQIAHNVRIGEDCTICAQVGIAGSTTVGDHVTIAGQAGINGHIHIGDGTLVYAGGKVIASLPPNSRVSGHYAQPHRTDIEQKVLLRKLPKLFEQVRMLMNALDDTRKSP